MPTVEAMPRALAVLVILLVIGLVVLAFRSDRPDRVAIADDQASPPLPPAATPTAELADTAAAGGGEVERPWPTPPQQTATPPSATAVVGPSELIDLGPHPPLLEIDGWLQSDVASLEELRGRVVVVQFWTYGCHNCQATLPNLIELYGRYGREEVEIVGIHAPEFSHEAEVANIEAAAAELGVTWPIVLDTQKRTFHSWQPGTRSFWPRTYVLDRDGNIRYDHIGEGQYEQLQETVAALVADPAL